MFSKFMSNGERSIHPGPALILLISVWTAGCSVETAKTAAEPAAEPIVKTRSAVSVRETKAVKREATTELLSEIEIRPNSPADTVRAFYQRLKQNKFREALVLTNLRPAIEGLTATELRDLQIDFGHLARNIPADFVINGEIIVGDRATVTANLPDEDTGEKKIQEIKLRRDGDFWTILTVDEEAEKVVRKQGKNYFFTLRIETHHDEAKAMIERVFKAQLVYSAQHGGVYGDLETLVNKGFLPEDITTSVSTGYRYNIKLDADKKTYAATAVPEEYGKTGRLSYLLFVDEHQNPHFKKKDAGGKSLKR